ncbi:pyridoxalphosphate dependent aminotransferase class III [Candidatus Thiomargarita nelsonii]|uniref:Pyridoxalphosphate dependent aminotransferase class III n=1 Tax=Candidatus Thiomargarita nelsonii TaxID=1003181 RepID=A0A176RUV1_9GAMM|nr:pyridoxalphosphate dependent aminotransferase class III [Candidatus Thiomargarita nelsonii]
MVGLGAYTSIVTNNGQTINDYEVPITTGNAYTAALVLLGIDYAAREQNIDIATAKVAVVGATGNIGLVLAKVLIQQVGQLHLIGRQGESGLFRLRYARQQCLQELLALIHQESVADIDFHEMAPGMIARKVYQVLNTKRERAKLHHFDDEAVAALFAGLDAEKLPTDMGTVLEKVLADEPFDNEESYGVELHTDMAILRSCDIVVVATNSPDPHLITPEKVRPGSIVCCASVPSNLSPTFEDKLDHFYAFEGGLARLPENSRIDFVGMPGADICYGCIAETLLTGFDGHNHSFCKGLLEVEHVYQALEMANQHGFSLGDLKLNDKVWKQVTSVPE